LRDIIGGKKNVGNEAIFFNNYAGALTRQMALIAGLAWAANVALAAYLVSVTLPVH